MTYQGNSINDFSIRVATVNGSGSQSANTVLTRAIFQMGIPVSGKNLFPSNIAGLPTWFNIRVSEKGYFARKAETELVIALNPRTAREDAASVQTGGALLVDETFALGECRSDITIYEAPMLKLAAEATEDLRLRKMLANMVYVGALVHILSLDMSEVERVVQKQFMGKATAIQLSLNAVYAGYGYAAEHLIKTDPFRLVRTDKTVGKILIDGNKAAALGAMFGGCTVVTWYPITPSTSLVEELTEYMRKYRIDPDTGKATFAVVQAEDELAAIGMVIGAGWAGARAMTSTSGPGFSLMSEFAGFAYFAEVPAVIWDIQRIGPSTGLPTRTSQGDILSAYFLSHGDTKHILLLPGTVEECFAFAQVAFNLAEQFQTLVFCMSDLDLAMNNWIADEFSYPDDIPIHRGKILTEEDLDRLGSFSRYRDVDGDGIPFRTIPGNNHPAAAYFTRGSGHDTEAEYSEHPEKYTALVDRIARKIKGSVPSLPQPIISGHEAQVGILAYGSTHHAMDECRNQLSEEHGIRTDYLRIRSLPPSDAVREFIERHERTYLVEQNRDGQMRAILAMEFPSSTDNLRSVLHYNGIPIDARFVTNAIFEYEQNETGTGKTE